MDRYFAVERPLAPFEVGDIPGFNDWVVPCASWPTPRPSPPVPADASYPRIPVLAVAGDFDTRSPDEVAALIGRFPRSTLLRVRYGGHALASHFGPHGRCVRGVMRAFLADPRHPAPAPAEPGGCSAENYRAVGSFPQTIADVPAAESVDLADADRRLVAAAFATAADAVARRNPNDIIRRPATEPGLRGGEVRWDADARAITFDEVRFVEDLAVSGTVRLDAEHEAAAELRAVGPDGHARELTLRWRAFVAESHTAVVGRLDVADFTARVPLH